MTDIDTSLLKVPPQNIEAELSILGGILLDNQALNNVLSIVRAAGGDITTIARTTIYTTEVRHWEEVNRVYADFFGPIQPARSIITVAGLHHNALVEIEAVAFTL